jgi:TP901 family phage tail tape measure protein
MAAFTPVGVEFVARGLRQFESRINHVNDGILDLADSIDKLGKEVADTAQKDFNALTEGILDVQDSVRDLGQTMGQQASGGGGLGAFLENAANLGSVIGGIGSVVGPAISAVANLGKAMIGAAIDGAQFFARKLVGVIEASANMAGAFESATNTLGIAASADIAKGTTTFEELSDAALAVGGDVRLIGVDALQSAEAISGLYKAGLTTEQIFGGPLQDYLAGDAELFGALRASIDLAAASELNMVEASELATTLMFTFGREAEDLGIGIEDWVVGAMNNMVQAADASVTSVPELTAALGNAGPILSSYGFKLSDVNTALAVMSQQGIRGAEAGTALRSMFSVMTGGGKKAEKAMKELGVELYDQQGNMFSLGEIVLQFANQMGGTRDIMVEVGGRTAEQNAELKRLKGIYASTAQDLRDYEIGISGVGQSEEARQKSIDQLRLKMVNLGAAIGELESIQGTASKRTIGWTQQELDQRTKNIAGPYGKTALVALLAGEAEGWTNMATAVGDAATIQEVSAKRAESLNSKMEAFQGVIQTLSIGIGVPFRELKKEFLGAALPIIETYGPRFAEMLSGLGESLQEIGRVVFDLDWDAIIGDLLSGDLSTLVEGLSFAGLELGVPEQAVNFVADLIEKGGELVTWLRDTIPGAIATASTYWTDTLWPAMQGVWGWVQGTAIPIIQRTYNWLQDQIPRAVEQAASLWETTLEPAIGTVVGAFENLVAFWDTHGPGIQETASNLFAKFAEITTDLSESVIPFLVEQFEKVSAWYVENGPLIEQAIKTAGEAWSGLSGFVVEAWQVIEPILGGIVDLVLGIVELGMNIAVRDWEAAWGTIVEVATNVGQAIGEAVEGLLDLITKALGGESWDAVKEQWAGNWELFTTIVSTVWANIVTAVSTWLTKAGATIQMWGVSIQAFWEKLWAGIRDWVVQAWTNIIAFFSDAWTTIRDMATTLWQSIVDTVVGAVLGLLDAMGINLNSIVGRWTAIWQDILAIGTEIWDRISGAITERLTIMRDRAAEIWAAISATATEVWTAIVSWVTEQAQAIYDGVTKVIQELKDWWDPIWDGISEKATEIWEAIVTWVSEQAQEIYNSVTKVIGELKDWWGEIWGEIVTETTERSQNIFDAISGAVERIKTWLGEQWESLVKLGGDIISGLVQGVLGGAGKLIEALTSGVEDAVAAVKEFLGIESPSKLFAGLGEEMTAGLAEGLAESTPELLREQAAMVSDLVQAMSDELASASATLKNVLEGVNDLLVKELAPAFEFLAELLEDEALPAFEDLMEMFEDDLVDAIEEAADALEEKFLDAGEKVLRWLQTRFIPALEDLADTLRIDIVQASYTISGVWTGVLIPALNFLAQTLESGARLQVDLLGQAFGNLAGSSQSTATAFGTLNTVVGDVATALGGFRTAIDNVYNQTGLFVTRIVLLAQAFERLAEAIYDTNFQLLRFGALVQGLPPTLPEYLQTHSVSPFEAAVRGIADAVHDLAQEELPALIAVLSSPFLQGGLQATAMAMMGVQQMAMAPVAAPAVYPSRNVSVGPVTIQNGMDEARFMSLFRRAIRTEMGGI